MRESFVERRQVTGRKSGDDASRAQPFDQSSGRGDRSRPSHVGQNGDPAYGIRAYVAWLAVVRG
jgi:hypothetical protein